jgi:hypothetical protein
MTGFVRSALATLAALSAVTLTSCAERTPDGFSIVNRSDIETTVTFVDAFEDVTVDPGHREVVVVPDCIGTAVRVTAAGHPDVKIEGSACAGSVLYIEEDHSAYIESMYA